MSLNLTIHEALIYTMITMSAVDSDISDTELGRIGAVVKNSPVFEGFDVDQLVTISARCGEDLAKDNGLNNVLTSIAIAVPEKLRETAYAFAVEIAIIDRKIEKEEIRFLQMLRDSLHLDKLITSAIERGARARHRKI